MSDSVVRERNNRTVEIPESFVERYGPLVDDLQAFLACLKKPLPRSFRVNTLKSNRQEITARFSSYGIPIIRSPWYQDAFVCPEIDPGPTLEHFLGKIYLQELTSMLPPLVISGEIQRADCVLDACAAPGSKTTQIAALMNLRGTLIANDKDYNRIRGLKHNLSKAGAQNIVITNCDLSAFPQERLFDVVMLDAPCSSDGTVRKNPAQLRRWTSKKSARYSSQQRFLIKTAYDLVRPGGTLMYSTCSFSPDENELVVDHLVRHRPAVIESISLENITLCSGLTVIDGVELSSALSKTARVWGHHNDTGGFYLAKIRKPESQA